MNKVLKTLRVENLSLRKQMREDEFRRSEALRVQRESEFATQERWHVENNYSLINQQLRTLMAPQSSHYCQN